LWDHNGVRHERSAFRLSPEAREILEQLAARHGIARTAVLEILLRQATDKTLASREGELMATKMKGADEAWVAATKGAREAWVSFEASASAAEENAGVWYEMIWEGDAPSWYRAERTQEGLRVFKLVGTPPLLPPSPEPRSRAQEVAEEMSVVAAWNWRLADESGGWLAIPNLRPCLWRARERHDEVLVYLQASAEW
jgi:hypothetical protein